VSKKTTANSSGSRLKLARSRRVRLFEADDKRILKESKRTGQTAVELIRQAVSFGMPELFAPQDQ
jgi:hypothetical protein